MKTTQSVLTLLIQRKSILGLSLAAISLVLLGSVLSDFDQVLFKAAIMLFIFWPVYLFDEWLDHKDSGNNSIHPAVLQMGIGAGLSLGVVFYLLSLTSFLSLLGAFVLGLVYNANIPFIQRKPKQIFLIKNIQIGIGWALLVLFGSGDLNDVIIWALLWSAFSQVFIGSVVRDIEDIQEDKNKNVMTLPVRLSIAGSFKVLHLLNLIFAIVLFFIGWGINADIKLIYALLAVYVLRSVHLYFLKKEGQNFSIYKSLNLLFCGILFVFFLIAKKVI